MHLDHAQTSCLAEHAQPSGRIEFVPVTVELERVPTAAVPLRQSPACRGTQDLDPVVERKG